jgi:hypothetical protein
LGLKIVWGAFAQRDRRLWGSALLCLVLAFSLGTTVRDYFFRYDASPEAAYAFEAAATELGAEINRFTGVGWDGEGLIAPTAVSNPHVEQERRVYLDIRLWQAWKGLSFLVPEQQALITFQPDGTPPLSTVDQTLLLVWPYDDWQTYLAALPHPAQVEAHAGPLTRGDLEEQPYTAYASYRVGPIREQGPTSLARFGDAIELVDVTIANKGSIWDVRLSWSTQEKLKEDYTTFVYVCDDRCTDGDLMAQDDGQPGDGYYPTHMWHPGDIVVDTHQLEVPPDELAAPTIAVGLYSWPALERLPVTSASAASSEDMFILVMGDRRHDED